MSTHGPSRQEITLTRRNGSSIRYLCIRLGSDIGRPTTTAQELGCETENSSMDATEP